MKSITRLSLALMMFALFSVSYLVTTVAADPQGEDTDVYESIGGVQKAPSRTTQGNYNAPNARRGQMRGQTHQGAAGTRQGGQHNIIMVIYQTRGDTNPKDAPMHHIGQIIRMIKVRQAAVTD
jgi:hypothetical protein